MNVILLTDIFESLTGQHRAGDAVIQTWNQQNWDSVWKLTMHKIMYIHL